MDDEKTNPEFYVTISEQLALLALLANTDSFSPPPKSGHARDVFSFREDNDDFNPDEILTSPGTGEACCADPACDRCAGLGFSWIPDNI